MARVSWRGDLKRLRARIENLPEEALDAAANIMEDVVDQGAQEMKQIIATSSTPTGLAEGREGRIKTGSMYEDVESTTRRNRRSVSGTFGWGVDGGTVKKYYQYQEDGFQHWLSGKDVSPMHAMLTSFIHMREEFFQRARAEFGRGTK